MYNPHAIANEITRNSEIANITEANMDQPSELIIRRMGMEVVSNL